MTNRSKAFMRRLSEQCDRLRAVHTPDLTKLALTVWRQKRRGITDDQCEQAVEDK